MDFGGAVANRHQPVGTRDQRPHPPRLAEARREIGRKLQPQQFLRQEQRLGGTPFGAEPRRMRVERHNLRLVAAGQQCVQVGQPFESRPAVARPVHRQIGEQIGGIERVRGYRS